MALDDTGGHGSLLGELYLRDTVACLDVSSSKCDRLTNRETVTGLSIKDHTETQAKQICPSQADMMIQSTHSAVQFQTSEQ
jgi:hypothetical protein